MAYQQIIRCLVLAISLLVNSVFAGDIALNFKEVPVNKLTEAVIKGFLNQDYVISPEAAGADSKISLSVSGLDRDGVKFQLDQVLASVGLQLAERRGVLYVEKRRSEQPVLEPQAAAAVRPDGVPFLPSSIRMAPSVAESSMDGLPNDDVHVYFPKYRSAEYLALAVRASGARLIGQQQVGQQAVMQQYMPGMVSAMPVQQIQPMAAQGVQSGPSMARDVLMFSGSVKVLEKADKLIGQLDRPSVAVQLRGVVLEVTDSTESVRSFNAALNLLGGKIGATLEEPAFSMGAAVLLKWPSLSVVLKLLEGDSRFRYLAEPSLRVVDGETAKITVGQEVPTRGAVSTDRNGNTLQSVEYRTSGLVFDVTPQVYESILRLKINQQVSTFQQTTTSGIDSPTLLKREAQTVVQAEDGELIAIGGLDESTNSASNSGLPFLPQWMRSKNDNTRKTQVLLLLEVKKVRPTAI